MRQNFDGDATADFGVYGFVDATHAPDADEGVDLVGAHLRSNQRIVGTRLQRAAVVRTEATFGKGRRALLADKHGVTIANSTHGSGLPIAASILAGRRCLKA
jgi:hypothetical protein